MQEKKNNNKSEKIKLRERSKEEVVELEEKGSRRSFIKGERTSSNLCQIGFLAKLWLPFVLRKTLMGTYIVKE